MRKPRPKTNAQVRRLFGLAKPLAAKCEMTPKEYLEQVLASSLVTCHSSQISELYFDEANAMIKFLGGDPFSTRGNSIRNQNYKKQAAGIKTIETDAHLHKIHDLAAARNMSDEGLQSLSRRMNQPWPPQTTEQGNRIVEALKAMNKRDNVKAFPVRTASDSDRAPSTKEPSFRRVA